MLLRCRSHKGTALPRPPGTGAAPVPPSLLGVRLHDHAVGLEHRAAFMALRGGPGLPPGLPRHPAGWRMVAFRVAVAGRAGGLNGACEPSLGGRPALISPALLRRSDAGAGGCPAAPQASKPRQCPRGSPSPPWRGSCVGPMGCS